MSVPLNEYIDLEAYDVVSGSQYRDLRHNVNRMLQALDAYWLHYDGYSGKGNPRSRATEEDWWIRFEKYRARVEALTRERGNA